MKLSPSLSHLAAATVLTLLPALSIPAWAQSFGDGVCADSEAPPPDEEDMTSIRAQRARAMALSEAWGASGSPACSALIHDAPLLRQSLDQFQGWQQQQMVRLHQRRLTQQLAGGNAASSTLSGYINASSAHSQQDGDEVSARLSSLGLTVGADYRLNERWVVGGSLGMSAPRLRWRGTRSRVDGHALTGALYASVSPTEQTYVSATATVGSTRYKLFADPGASDGEPIESSARSKEHGLSVMAGVDLPQNHGLTLSPYARWDLVRSRMRSTDEAYGGLTAATDRLSLGLQSVWAVPQPWGVLTPFARVELTHITRLNLLGASAHAYAGSSGAVPLPHPLKADRSVGQWSIGAAGVLQRGISLFADYEQGFGDAGLSQWRFTAGLRSEL